MHACMRGSTQPSSQGCTKARWNHELGNPGIHNTTRSMLTYDQDPHVPFAMGNMEFEPKRVHNANMLKQKLATEIHRARKCLVAAPDRQAAYTTRKHRYMTFHAGDHVFVDRNSFPAITRLAGYKWKARFSGPFLSRRGIWQRCLLEVPYGYDVSPNINVERLRLLSQSTSGRHVPPPRMPHVGPIT